MARRAVLVVIVMSSLVAASAVTPSPARALTCPQTPLTERVDNADAVFVGRLVSSRPAPAHTGQRLYTFVVDQQVKGPVGREIEVRAPRLTDSEGTPLAVDVAVGVLASLEGATFVTSSCGLVDPGGLLEVTNAPRGGRIKVAIGIVILAVVLAYSYLRLRRRRREEASRLAP